MTHSRWEVIAGKEDLPLRLCPQLFHYLAEEGVEVVVQPFFEQGLLGAVDLQQAQQPVAAQPALCAAIYSASPTCGLAFASIPTACHQEDITERNGLPVTTVERRLIDVAAAGLA